MQTVVETKAILLFAILYFSLLHISLSLFPPLSFLLLFAFPLHFHFLSFTLFSFLDDAFLYSVTVSSRLL